LHCDFASNQTSQPLTTSFDLQIIFLFQTKVPITYTLQTPFLLQIESPNTHEEKQGKRQQKITKKFKKK
jgi:hypothetical protein